VDQVMGLPEFDGYIDSTQPGSDDFKVFLQDISRRADDVRQKRVDPHVDNLLKITTDGRKAALDMRLIDMVYGLDPDSKVYRCAEKIMEIYEQTKDTKAIQMVFCDISTPKAGFNLYDELKGLLKAMGMPEHEIAYIHEAQSEAQKNLLFRDLQKGLKRVVIGSTFKMGLGVNVQERLVALHHLDVPWRPADMVQREGRILRQGNTCDSVQIYRYITKGSFDAYSWQLLETKQRFISQILSGHIVEREGEDVDEAVLNYAEVKALAVGNPKIKRRVEVVNELDKYRLLHQDFIDQQHKKKMRLKELPGLIEKQKARIANTQIDMDFVAATPNDYGEMKFEEQRAIRDAIYTAVKTHINHPLEKKVVTFRNFDVVVPAHMQPKVPKSKYDENGNEIPTNKEPIPYVFVKRTGSYYMEVESSSGITKRLNNLIDGLAEHKKRLEDYLQVLENERSALQQDLMQKEDSYGLQIEILKAELDQLNEELGVNVA
jgi:superfamily II DNA/RNA helicase